MQEVECFKSELCCVGAAGSFVECGVSGLQLEARVSFEDSEPRLTVTQNNI